MALRFNRSNKQMRPLPRTSLRIDAASRDASSLAVAAVGPWGTAEFRSLHAELDPRAQWPTHATLAQALEDATLCAAPPDVILVAQPRPGMIEQLDIECAARQWPLARIVVVAGS